MKRVLMLAYYFPPSKAAGTFRTLRFVRDLPQFGWRPVVLTVREATYPKGDQDQALLHKVPDETRVYRTWAPPFHRWYKNGLQIVRNSGRGQRSQAAVQPGNLQFATERRTVPSHALNDWLYTLCRTPDVDAGWRAFAFWRGLWAVLRERPAVLYATGGPWTTFLVARDLARVTRLPLVLDYRDPWCFNPALRHNHGFFAALAEHLERSAVRAAERIVANTDALRAVLQGAHGVDVGGRCSVIHNSFDEADYSAPAPPRSKQLLLCYVGSLYEAHNPEPFLLAVAHLLQRAPQLRGRFLVRLVGSGALPTAGLVRRLGLDGVVEMSGPVPHAEAIRQQRAADILLLFLTVPSDESTFIPSKLFEYVAARRPVFAVTRGGALEQLLRERKLTRWVYQPADCDGIADGLVEAIAAYENGRLQQFDDQTVDSFSGRAAAQALAQVLHAAATRQPAAEAPQRIDTGRALQPAETESP